MPPIPLLVLLFSTTCVQPNQIQELWRSVRANETWISQESTTSARFQASSSIVCAGIATQTDWCRTYCFQGNTCHLHDADVDDFPEESEMGNVTDCKTRFFSVGTTVTPTIAPTTAAQCPLLFEDLGATGCFQFMAVNRSWSTAETDCLSLQGFLASPNDFQGLVSYLLDSGEVTAEYWVGARSSEWSDGHPVESSQLAPNSFQENAECMKMIGAAGFLLGTESCSRRLNYICQASRINAINMTSVGPSHL